MVALVAVVALGAVIGVQNSTKSTATTPTTPTSPTTPTPPNNTNSNVCLTPSCIDLSAAVRQALNEDINPCEDFYNFSCGGWENRNVVPPSTLLSVFPLMGTQCAL